MIALPIVLAYAGIALLLYDTAVRSWRMAGRVDDPARMFARPAPAVGRHRIGPAVPSRRLDDDPVRGWTYDDDGLVELTHRGATEGWSPLQEVEAVERTALPLDDVDEYLADLDRRFAAILVPDPAVDEELRAFQQGSMRLHAYRSMILDSTGGYGPREAMQLEALLAA